MPLWQIQHHPSAFSADQKKALSDAIANIYHDLIGLPKFYAVVIFSPNEDIFVGGEPDPKFVRITMSHIARESEIKEGPARWFQTHVDAVLKPYIQDRGMRWEYSYDNSPRMFWKINGMVPPDEDSEMERKWRKENRAVSYE